MVHYTRSLALDRGCDGIRVDAVCPGPIETPLLAPALTIPGVPEEYARRLPLGRIGRPEEVAAASAFLASDDASYVMGSLLVVDGGITAHTGWPDFARILEQLAAGTQTSR